MKTLIVAAVLFAANAHAFTAEFCLRLDKTNSPWEFEGSSARPLQYLGHSDGPNKRVYDLIPATAKQLEQLKEMRKGDRFCAEGTLSLRRSRRQVPCWLWQNLGSAYR